MCTTYLASELLLEFKECDPIGYPRLVRLNPNIPWKTRGNGAITLRFGRGSGRKFQIGEINGKRFFAYETGKPVEIPDAVDRLKVLMEAEAMFEDPNTNPAFVVMNRKPSPGLYWKAVREVVKLKNVKNILKRHNADFVGYKNKRGLIGAASAISWRPRDRTYEIITYREKKRWGTKRRVEKSSVIEMNEKFPSTFNNYDYRNEVVAISPSSPCPVLFGIRGDDPGELPRAMKTIKSEKKDRWILFLTNQGTDEHLKRRSIPNVRKYTSVITSGQITAAPRTIEGGHVLFQISRSVAGKGLDCAAYEPTKEFRELIRKLLPGDLVTVYGGVRESPVTINVEKIRIDKLVEKYKKIENPRCPECKKHMKSMGRNCGYRCPRCRTKVGEEKAKRKRVTRGTKPGLYEVPVCARRHLAKPIKRMNRKKGEYK